MDRLHLEPAEPGFDGDRTEQCMKAVSVMPRVTEFALALAAALMLAACSEPTLCTDDIRPAVEVTIVDRTTQDYLVVVPRGVVREGMFEDSLEVWSTTLENPPRVVSMTGADERAGVYAVQLEADGYQLWDTAGVAVSRDECHVRTATFTAEMEPSP
jgi:hypothetical protein